MNLKITIATSISLAMAFWAPVSKADTPQTARPGTLNYVEGQASIGREALGASSVGAVELEPNESLTTDTGKAEVLLTPGVFLRLGDMSTARMISSGLLDTELALDEGKATVEVTDLHHENDLRIVEDGIPTELHKTGLYEFDADQHLVRVFTGQAFVYIGNHRVKVNGGRQVNLQSVEPVKAQKFDRKMAEQDDLYRWTSLRSSYLAEANADEAQTYMNAGLDWYSDGWFWDPWYGAYTFMPCDGILFSPFGWGYYSPYYAYQAPFFYGVHYYHHFSPNYTAWGPGAHYGMPANYGHGVHYGPRSTFNGPGFAAGGRTLRSGVSGGGMRGGYHGGSFHGSGFHGGGFHGGSFSGGGFHGGGFHGGGFGGGGFHGGGFGGGGFHGGGGFGGGHH